MCPYIPEEDQGELRSSRDPEDTGELTYMLTFYCVQYLLQKPYVRFEQISEVLAALSATHDEFYRRIVSPYEDRKAKTNGDVFAELLTKMAMPEFIRGNVE